MDLRSTLQDRARSSLSWLTWDLWRSNSFGPRMARHVALPVIVVIVLDKATPLSWYTSLGIVAATALGYITWQQRDGLKNISSKANQPTPSGTTPETFVDNAPALPTQRDTSFVPSIDDTQPTPIITPPSARDIRTDNTQAEDEVRYREHFHFMFVIERVAPAALSTIILLTSALVALVTDTVMSPAANILWPAGVGVAVMTLGYWYYTMLVWRGSEFVATFRSYSLPVVMPWPFSDQNPTIRANDVAYNYRRTFLDKLLGTCRLSADTPNDGDEMFHEIKWLKYPEKVQLAIGGVPTQRSRWSLRR